MTIGERMNIFMLDQDPATAARYHCDKHVVKMILESAQLLSTAINLNSTRPNQMYKTTHQNHPCSLWVQESRDNALWLVEMTHALNAEYKYRYRRMVNHKSWDMLTSARIKQRLRCLPSYGMTTPALAMPDRYWVLDPFDAVASYRAYYRGSKADMLSYTRRGLPEWLVVTPKK